MRAIFRRCKYIVWSFGLMWIAVAEVAFIALRTLFAKRLDEVLHGTYSETIRLGLYSRPVG